MWKSRMFTMTGPSSVTQRNVAADQEQQSARNLQEASDVHVMAYHECFAEVGRERWLLLRHRDEVQKDVRAEDEEHESQQDAGDDGGDFHAVMLNETKDISIVKTGGCVTPGL